MTSNAIPSPVQADGKVYLMSGFRGSALLAIDLAEASGDITDSDAILWKHDRDTPYVPSPLLYRDRLYFLKSNNGVLSSFDVKTGERVFGPQRLGTVANAYATTASTSYIPD